jgi:hypothetical protein
VPASDHEQEWLFAEAGPLEATLVGRGPTLERDAGGLAAVAEHHGEIELSRDHAGEQLVRLRRLSQRLRGLTERTATRDLAHHEQRLHVGFHLTETTTLSDAIVILSHRTDGHLAEPA